MAADNVDLHKANELRRQAWREQAPDYDKRIGFFERRLFGQEHRAWACARARDYVLEVAVGTCLNLPHYPDAVRLVGIDLSPDMLALARRRAEELGREVDLREGDAHDLPFADETFDSVVCTYSLCNIPDEVRAISEMRRVLKPGGTLLLVDHVRSSVAPIRWVQRAIELVSVRVDGDHMTRRPLPHVKAAGFEIRDTGRFRAGIVERLEAVKPHAA